MVIMYVKCVGLYIITIIEPCHRERLYNDRRNNFAHYLIHLAMICRYRHDYERNGTTDETKIEEFAELSPSAKVKPQRCRCNDNTIHRYGKGCYDFH